MLLQSGTPTLLTTYRNQDGSEAGGSVGLRWLLTLPKYLRHAGKTRLVYPWAAACWFTTGPFLQNSTWMCRSTAPFICHPLDPHLSDFPPIGIQTNLRLDWQILIFFPWQLFSRIVSRPPLPPWQTLIASSKLSVRCATSNHKVTTAVFILTFFSTVYRVCNHVIAVYSENKLQHYATAYRNHKSAGEKLCLVSNLCFSSKPG